MQGQADQTINYVDDVFAAGRIRDARRIMVIGCSGGGKSTLAQKLASHFDLTYLSIDRDIRWLPGWVQRSKEEQCQRIVDRIADERWIMDGTNTSTFDIRLPRTDIVIWVRMPRLLCIWGVLTRWLKHLGRSRPEMAPGCIEKVDWQFLEFIWTFEKKFTPRIIEAIAAYGPHVPVLQVKSRRQMRALLDLLGVPA
ncbi:adenylate kinase family enzyme [Rhizobium sp. BK196]|uniref:AAA family ATPase n=1 Tax=Rhizobium sp. BK196 TaxID=2587073 RepID=UPI0016176637|nr:AAA family ATPase [Rhizobium sp. BK196]MBB3312171.1 adenylate kinase family enzyme [Rhizobium sp. BK196]